MSFITKTIQCVKESVASFDERKRFYELWIPLIFPLEEEEERDCISIDSAFNDAVKRYYSRRPCH